MEPPMIPPDPNLIAMAVVKAISIVGVFIVASYTALRFYRMRIEEKTLAKSDDISNELMHAIKAEFSTMRAENAELRNRLAQLEGQVQQALPDEVRKQQQVQQR